MTTPRFDFQAFREGQWLASNGPYAKTGVDPKRLFQIVARDIGLERLVDVLNTFLVRKGWFV